MRIPKDVPVKIDVPGATARQQTEFGDKSGYSKFGGEDLMFNSGAELHPAMNPEDLNRAVLDDLGKKWA
jgi:hypothetical protein